MELVDPLTDPRWAELVRRAPAALVFHQPAWIALVCGQYRYPVAAWALAGPGGRLSAGLPVALVRSRLTGARLIALPFSETCPPLIDPESAVDPEAFARRLDEQRRARNVALEVRAELPSTAGAQVFRTFVQHRLELDGGVAAVEARFAKSQVRRGIAKARREGVVVERRADAAALARFFPLHVRTRRRQGLPTPSKRFVMRFAELFDRGMGFVLLARREGRDIAAAVFVTDGRTLTYEFGASDPEHLAVRPNNLLFMEAIRRGCETGHRTLDLGRTDLDNHGLRAFKSSWGAQETPLCYSRFGPPAPAPGDGRARALLSAAIRRSPPAFGRLVGSALYRHLG